MYTDIWVKHLRNPKEQEKFKNTLLGSKTILERQTKVLSEKEEEVEKEILDKKSFDLPNWDYRQAYNNGYIAGLQYIKKLNTLDQQEHK